MPIGIMLGEYICVVCRAGGFSPAARQLGIAQSTLSRSIARLEAQLALRLFERNGRATIPTEHALLILERGEHIFRGVHSLGRELEQLTGSEQGRIRIGVGPAARLRPLPQLITALTRNYPRLRIETIQYGGDQLMSAVNNGEVDFGLAV